MDGRGPTVRLPGMALTDDQLKEVLTELTRKPGHEKVRVLVWKLLTDGLEFPSTDVDFEKREVRGRIDALLGRTVFEFKSDLAKEQSAADIQLTLYVGQREAATGEHYVGIATDGAKFVASELAN